MVDDFGSIDLLVTETQLAERQVRLALAYRESHPDEVAEAIAQNRRPPRSGTSCIRSSSSRLPRSHARCDCCSTRTSPRVASYHGFARVSTTCSHWPGTPPTRGLPDPHVLELAAAEQRILITRNSRDFAPLARQWAEAQRSHAGLMLIWTLDHSRFAKVAAGVERQLAQRPTQEQWQDVTIAF
ncbi:MAG TPA: DUF5615 family PIN-like protein [Solirubrobacteraceae bacterium]|nr:DUF5615 family PIN-like protein [Solirubrobacteraceae bacterium]